MPVLNNQANVGQQVSARGGWGRGFEQHPPSCGGGFGGFAVPELPRGRVPAGRPVKTSGLIQVAADGDGPHERDAGGPGSGAEGGTRNSCGQERSLGTGKRLRSRENVGESERILGTREKLGSQKNDGATGEVPENQEYSRPDKSREQGFLRGARKVTANILASPPSPGTRHRVLATAEHAFPRT